MSSSQQPPPAPTLQHTPPAPLPLKPIDLQLLQQKAETNGEAVPASHASPPSIADWPREQIQTAVANFREHLNWFGWHFATLRKRRAKKLDELEEQVVYLAEHVLRGTWMAVF
ncbi:hypothetical protein EDC01DRAFT_780684 [Geopyxis carbonaria]|nr:hypothetical protein EDC01DRAFT_780684 [Geopyxis carbonaria]